MSGLVEHPATVATSTDDVDDEGNAPNGCNSSLLARLGLSPFDAFVLVVAGLTAIAYFPVFQFDRWTPRVALVCLVAPLGLGHLIVRSARRDWVSVAGVAVVIWVVISGIASGARVVLIGSVGADLSAALVCGYVGFWSLGRALSMSARRLLVDVVVWTAVLNGLVAIAQVTLQLDSGPFALYFGRAYGLMVHPVYFGALMGMALAGLLAIGGRVTPMKTAVYLPIAMGCALSGSRAVVGAAVVTILLVVAVRRSPTSFAHTGLAIVGLAAGEVFSRVFSPESSAVGRVADAGFSNRFDVWRYGLQAVGDRPVFGWGFGRFTAAVQGRFEIPFVRSAALDDPNQIWFDPHNVVIAVVVATGVVGLLLFTLWVALSLVGSRGPLLWMLLPVALSWLVEPVSLMLAPIALLVLGAASCEKPTLGDHPIMPPVRATVAMLTLGAVLATYVLTADLVFKHEVDEFDPAGAATASRLYLDDPVVMDLVAQMYALTLDDSTALTWQRRVVDSQPDRPYWWTLLADRQIELGDLDGASASIDRAYALRPVSFITAQTELRLGEASRDRDRLEHAAVLACQLIDCDRTVAELVELGMNGELRQDG